MNREQMIEKIADLIVTVPGIDGTARAILDEIRPQVTTVAELEALPIRTLLKGDDGDVWQRSHGGCDCLSETGEAGAYFNSTVIRRSAPLTVVWTP